MLKRAIVVFNVLVNIFLLTGCWNYVEIDEQINVSGFAIDVGENGKKYHFSAEIIMASLEEKGPLNSNVIETDADTVFEAIRNLLTLTSKRLYFGHCKTMVIGEGVAKHGIKEILDLPVRNHELRTTIDIVISKGCKAKEILLTEAVVTTIIAYRINDILKNSKAAVGESPFFKTYLVYNNVQAEGVATVIPALEIRNIEDKKVAKLLGVGVFKEDKLVGFLDEIQTKQLSFINNKIKSGLLTTESLNDKNKSMSYEIYKSKTKTKISFDNNEITVNINVKTYVNIGEAETKADYSDPKEVDKARENLQRNMEKDLNNLIKVAQKDFECDIFGIGNKINKNYPNKWHKYKENWEETFQKIKFNVKSEVRIKGSGVTNMAA